MSRSVWKGPFVDPSLIKKVEKQRNQGSSIPIKTWSRKSTRNKRTSKFIISRKKKRK